MDGERSVKLFDLYELRYVDAFNAPFASLSAGMRLVYSLLLLIKNLPSAARLIADAFVSKRPSDRIQGVFLGTISLITLMTFVYWGVVAAAGVIGAETLLGWVEPDDRPLGLLAVIIAAVTAARQLFGDVFQEIEKLAAEFYSIMWYNSDDSRFSNTLGSIEEALVWMEQRGYEQVDVLSFSLGSLLANDFIYPRSHRLWANVPQVDNWISLGHPFDLMEAMYPGNYRGRCQGPLAIKRWVNVTVRADFLGSTFRRDGAEDDPDGRVGVVIGGATPTHPDVNVFFDPKTGGVQRALWDFFVPLRRLVNHALYWDFRDPRKPSCFGPLLGETDWIVEARATLASTDGA